MLSNRTVRPTFSPKLQGCFLSGSRSPNGYLCKRCYIAFGVLSHERTASPASKYAIQHSGAYLRQTPINRLYHPICIPHFLNTHNSFQNGRRITYSSGRAFTCSQVNSFPASSFPPQPGCPLLPASTSCHRPPRVQGPIPREHSTINRWRNPSRDSSPRTRPPYLP